MIIYILRRIAIIIPMIILLSIVVFCLAKMMPGDALGGEIDPTITDAAYIEEMREKLGYNDPWHIQYGRWVSDVVQGDFGRSVIYKRPAIDLIVSRIPNTLFLAISAMIITWTFALVMGMTSGRRPYTIVDNTISTFNYLGLAIPSYILALFAIYFLSFNLGWFPSTGSVSVGLEPGSWAFVQSRLYHVILPALCLGAFSAATYTQFLRNDIIENGRKDFVRTARAKGTSEANIYRKHIFRNSLIPLVTLFGFEIGSLIGGAIITESIFTYPGIGQLFLESITRRDYTVVMALTLILSLFTLVGSLIADILYGLIDPRIRLE
ncbi:oligopeptide ABC transporter permease [Aureibacillus halotolerans]|uniref:Peptide/nickel transport system permease protein n=1 Tax=Aureibacillus halotolerans TaxID=1508390 RepID=A0A4V6PWJ9_9BACI|nr:oligopeptide ABC transporter permease [Aureibacillus halotolerans]TDQ42127.1 peptide/nickel transport system permease protein [Aureibacillus halotolerans]